MTLQCQINNNLSVYIYQKSFNYDSANAFCTPEPTAIETQCFVFFLPPPDVNMDKAGSQKLYFINVAPWIEI